MAVAIFGVTVVFLGLALTAYAVSLSEERNEPRFR